jgi:selenocysteine lyase/cysteine desulfurase
LSGASNVLGTFNDISKISKIVHEYGAALLVDGAQMVAHRPVRISEMGIDYFAMSAHKMYAPFGTGILLVKKGLLHFSKAELAEIRASGEENITGIAALGKAMVLLNRIGMAVIRKEEQALTARALSGLSRIAGLEIFGVNDPAAPRFSDKGGVIVFNLKGTMADRVADALSKQAGIGVRFGCHCAHMLIKELLHIGPMLQRFQHLIVGLFPKINLPGLVRVSFGIMNTEADVDALIDAMQKIANNAPRKSTLVAVKSKLNIAVTNTLETVYAEAHVRQCHLFQIDPRGRTHIALQ